MDKDRITEENYNEEMFLEKPPFSEINALRVIQSPTNPQWIKTRRIKGTNLSYVSGDLVIRLLNKAFKYRWSFEIKETRVVESADYIHKNKKTGQETVYPQGPVVQSLGRLTVPGWGVKEQWGAQPIIGGQDVQEHAFKASATDALKKCASMFGVTLDLYGTEGMVDLAVTPQDYLTDDDKSFEDMKQQMVEAQQNKNLPKAEPDLEEIEEMIEDGPEQEEQIQQNTQPTQPPVEQEQQQQQYQEPVQEPLFEQDLGPQAQPEQEEQPTAPPVQEQPQQKASNSSSLGEWRKQDIEDMKRIKNTLKLESNSHLDIYVKEFMNNQEATMLQHINPTNITDFITFMDINHLN